MCKYGIRFSSSNSSATSTGKNLDALSTHTNITYNEITRLFLGFYCEALGASSIFHRTPENSDKGILTQRKNFNLLHSLYINFAHEIFRNLGESDKTSTSIVAKCKHSLINDTFQTLQLIVTGIDTQPILPMVDIYWKRVKNK